MVCDNPKQFLIIGYVLPLKILTKNVKVNDIQYKYPFYKN